uniref:Isoform 2 of Inositol-3-phosphate synthase 1 n=1 Tax=Rattus norvegicus TaxID=10116 RepID=Q6AYK3-3
MEPAAEILVDSPDVIFGPEAIEARYEYRTTRVSREGGVLRVRPTATRFTFRTARQVPRLGVMLVGWGGNNGSTLTAAVLANRLRLTWPTRTGRKEANYYGSLTQAGTVNLGLDGDGREVFVPFSALLPMVAPNDLVFDGGQSLGMGWG